MTLLVLSYHRGRPGPDGNAPELLDAHFAHIAANFENVLPGERLPVTRHSVCLVFDGGFYDFPANVLPRLRRHGLRAVLAVAPATIRDVAMSRPDDRIAVATDAAYSQPASDGFCTWGELEGLVRTDCVSIAAHGYTHRALDRHDSDMEAELHVPRTLLATRLGTVVESLVFPFGRYTPRALAEARSGYDFVFGNGNASNKRWRQRILYRINADNLPSPTAPFTPARMLRHRIRFLWNRLARA